jgi:uncharacterized protein YndB with AHSA1/START domain/uncharacterized protein YciI
MIMNKPSARSVADVTRGVILASVDIAVPPERVFRAITDGGEIAQWWGSDELYRTTSWKSDFRVGGKWRADGVGSDGTPFYVEGEFVEIDRPRKLVQTWVPAWDGGHVTTLTYLLEPTEGGTRVVVRHEGFGERTDSCRSHGEGWAHVLGWLEGFVAPASGPPRASGAHFFCRLIAPRPTFAMDMNEEERAVMQAHAAYWVARMNEGKVVVFGPVGDPAGPWGLGVVKFPDLDAVQAFQAADPAILSKRGFRYEICPMLSTIYPE